MGIPPEDVVGGTFRSLSMSGLALLRRRVEEIATNIAMAHRCSVEGLRFMPDAFPPTYNNPDLWSWIGSADTGVRGGPAAPEMQWDVPITMGSEDFAFYTEHAPSAFIFLGQGSGEGRVDVRTDSELFPTNTTVHSPRFNLDESVL